jgi:hypothetical protein
MKWEKNRVIGRQEREDGNLFVFILSKSMSRKTDDCARII